MKFTDYQTEAHYDEYFEADGVPRPAMSPFIRRINGLSKKEILRRKSAAESALLQAGITFTVYGEQQGQIDRIFPFDIIPRIIDPDDWGTIERGLKQRIYAINEFIDDIYNDQKILKDKVIPKEIITSAKSYRPQCAGFHPPKRIWCHVTGTDIVRPAICTGRQPEVSFRCVLRAGESRGSQAHLSRNIQDDERLSY